MPCSTCLDSINVISVWWLDGDRGEKGEWGTNLPRDFMGGSFYFCVLQVTVG